MHLQVNSRPVAIATLFERIARLRRRKTRYFLLLSTVWTDIAVVPVPRDSLKFRINKISKSCNSTAGYFDWIRNKERLARDRERKQKKIKNILLSSRVLHFHFGYNPTVFSFGFRLAEKNRILIIRLCRSVIVSPFYSGLFAVFSIRETE